MPDVTGRAVSWRTADASLGAEQPERLGVAADGQGRLQLGFKHSGYTGEDPDGRSALLTITVGVDAAPLSATERQAMEARGIRFDGSVAFSGAAPVLDVSCERCKDVAKQIRQSAGLPRSIQAPGGSPIQARFDDVPGQTLYDLLTAPDGLKFELSVPGKVNRRVELKTSLNPSAFAAWWERYSKDGVLEWSDDVDPLIASLIDEGALTACLSSGQPCGAPSAAYVEHARGLAPAALPPGEAATLQREDLLKVDWGWTETVNYGANTRVKLSISPGLLLKAHPELVKDLTNDMAGLDALKGAHQ